jgi:hypothetical protein
MTQVPMIAFRCDRCLRVIHVDTNSQPSLERGKPPGGWVTLNINGPTSPASHLCADCAPAFEKFMEAGNG